MAAPLVPSTWGLPRWLQRQCDPTSTSFVAGSGGASAVNRTQRDWVTLGTLARPERSVVDGCGLVTPWEGSWSLDWWVGAEDRWYLPGRETTVRQRLVGDAPVVETAMRVRGGDVVHRVYAVSGADSEPWLVVEIENKTAAAVAVAVAVRPWGPTAAARVGSVAMDGSWMVIDDHHGVVLPQVPWRTYGASGEDPPVVGEVLSGAEGGFEAPLSCAAGEAEMAAILPLPHTLALRLAIPMTPPELQWRTRRARRPVTPTPPAPVPTPEQVSTGWRAQSDRGIRLEIPDPTVMSAASAARRHLVLVPAGEDLTIWPVTEVDYPAHVSVLGALDAWGFGDEAADVLGTWEERQALDGRFLGNDRRRDATGAALVALGNHWRATGNVDLVTKLVGPVAKGANWIDRRASGRRHRIDPSAVGLMPEGDAPRWIGGDGVTYHDSWWSLRGLVDAAAMLDAIDQPEAAADARRFAAQLGLALEASMDADCARLGVSVVPAGPGRSLDGGIVGMLDAVLLGVIDAHDPRVDATLDLLRQRHVVDGGVFEQVGNVGVSAALTARLARVELVRGEASAIDRLRWLAGAATPGVTWPEVAHPVHGGGVRGTGHDPVATAEFLLAVRDLLVLDRPAVHVPGLHQGAGESGRTDAGGSDVSGSGISELVLAPVVPSSWLGQSWEVHGLPTSVGTLGYAVRWHGHRAALLWEIEPAASVNGVRLRAPGLDAAWTGSGFSGEALLGDLPPGADAGPPDAGPPDAGPPDAGPPVAGPPVADGGGFL
jgi:hypothetical protein